MEAAIHITGKRVVKVLGAACLAMGVVAVSAVAASGAAVGAVAEGFRSAKNTMQKILKKEEASEEDEVSAESIDEDAAAEAAKKMDETAIVSENLAENTKIADVTAKES